MPRPYAHLDLDERRRLANWREAKIPVKEIALRLDRDASTLYREFKRNFGSTSLATSRCRSDLSLPRAGRRRRKGWGPAQARPRRIRRRG